MTEQQEEDKPYYKKLQELLSHYEDGWDILIKAHEAKDFDYPVKRKEGFEDDPYLPDTWIALVDKICDIIATEEFKLDVYPRRIEIIRPDQMLDAYTTTGLPDSYRHWSFGKRRIIEEKKYNAGSGLAYEIVINSEPSVAYCMENNSPVMQALVIAHACYGHNAVFKNNYLFQEHTNAESILGDVKRMKEFVFECERKYGLDEVSEFLDFCHAMQFMDMPDTNMKKKLSRADREKRAKEKKLQRHNEPVRESVFDTVSASADFDKANDNHPEKSYPYRGEKNVLGYMAEHFTHMDPWKRQIMRMRSELSEYFKPQMMTKVVNEGFASFIHFKTLEKLYDIGLFNYGMWMEFRNSHAHVLYQRPSVFKPTDPKTGEPVKDPITGEGIEIFDPQSMNPYTLGFGIFREIERICMDPTEEDREWFKHFAGNGDWIETVKYAMEVSNDETLIERFLSPALIRELSMFAVKDSSKRNFLEIVAVQDRDGMKKIREILARQYRISEQIPDCRVYDRQEMTDRCLILHHQMVNDQELDEKDTIEVLKHIHKQTSFPVVIESIDKDGDVEQRFSSPPDYDYESKNKIISRMLSAPS